jgi:hypothetical protein
MELANGSVDKDVLDIPLELGKPRQTTPSWKTCVNITIIEIGCGLHGEEPRSTCLDLCLKALPGVPPHLVAVLHEFPSNRETWIDMSNCRYGAKEKSCHSGRPCGLQTHEADVRIALVCTIILDKRMGIPV